MLDLNPEETHTKFKKIQKIIFEKISSKILNRNNILDYKNFFKFFNEEVGLKSPYSNYVSFLEYYFKTKWKK